MFNSMSSSSSRNSIQFLVEPYRFSDNSSFSVKEYKCPQSTKRLNQEKHFNNSSSFFSTNLSWPELSEIVRSGPLVGDDNHDTSNDDVVVNQPLTFRRIPRQVSSKRFNFLCSDRQVICDSIKSCCGNDCLAKFGKANLRVLRQKYLSLNGEEQDTFLISHMQLLKEELQHVGIGSIHVEYFLGMSNKCCRISFKIAHSIGNMRLQRIQQRLVKGEWIPFNKDSSRCLIGRHALNWMEIYFSTQCEVMPTT